MEALCMRCFFMMCRVFVLLLLVSGSLQAATPVQASGARADLPVLVVGLGEVDYPPFYYTGGQGMQGAAIEIIERLAATLGYRLEYNRYPWKRVQRNLQIGLVDLVLIYYHTEQRSRQALFLKKPYLQGEVSLFVRSDLNPQFTGDLQALSDYPLIGVRGYYYGQKYQALPESRKVSVASEAELVRRVADTRLQAVGIGVRDSVQQAARQQGLESRIRFLSPGLSTGHYYIAVSRARSDAPELAAGFSAALESYMQTEHYSQLMQRYRLTPPQQTSGPVGAH